MMIKKISIIVFTIILFSISAKSVEISDYDFNSYGGLKSVDAHDNSVVVLGYKGNGKYSIPYINLLDNNKWTELPNFVGTEGNESTIKTTWNSRIKFDREKNIWLNGKSLYKFEKDHWTEYAVGDEYEEFREYGQFTVDIYDNIWVATNVANYKDIDFSELYRFDGKTFTLVQKRNRDLAFYPVNVRSFAETIASLPDGRIAIHRYVDLSDFNDSTNDLLIFSQDLSHTGMELKTFDYDSTWGKSMTYMYPEPDGNIWFCYEEKDIPVDKDFTKFIAIHQGLVLLTKNNEWVIMDRENGMPFLGSRPISTYSITRKKDNGYMILFRGFLYEMNKEYKMQKFSWKKIFDHSVIYRSHPKITDELLLEITGELQKNEDEMNKIIIPKFHKIITDDVGNLWLLADNFLLKVPEMIMSIEDLYDNDADFNIYPNPVADMITLETGGKIIREVAITDLTGKDFEYFSFAGNNIKVEALSSGTYFLTVQFSDGTQGHKYFVKK